MGKVLTAIAAMMACVSAKPLVPLPTYPHEADAVVKVYCQREAGNVVGSAFRVTRDTYITAAHVIANGACQVNGHTIEVTRADYVKDYATFRGPEGEAILKADCEGFKVGGVYLARGYPGSIPMNVQTVWLAVNHIIDDRFVFLGEALPGMSGGPLIDERGVAVGVVVMRHPTRSTPLNSTSFCRG